MDVEEVLNKNKIPFQSKGADLIIRCLNPEHEDNNPSMRVDKVMGTFHCFPCGYKGNVFYHFEEEVDHLALKRRAFLKLLEQKQSETVGLTMPSDATPFDQEWRNISAATYRKFQAFTSVKPEFSGRVVFPIFTISNKIACFQGRHMGAEVPKYKVWPRKSKLPLYPRFSTVQNSVILVEGIFDAINLFDKGLPNAVCCFGTDNIQKDKISSLKMSGVQKIFVFFDGDDAGQQAAEKVHDLCEKAEIVSQNICLKGRDPGELPLNKVTQLRNKLYG